MIDKTSTHDAIVIGAGIVGLAVARSILHHHKGASVLVVEKERGVAAHQTGHNSGVIHSGTYYRPGSHKATLCVTGATAMIAYCTERGLPLRKGGKLIVAVKNSELERLGELERRAKENGVRDVRRLDEAGIREVEPHAAGIAALHIPGTATTDFRAVCESFAKDITDHGGDVVFGFEVARITNTSSDVIVESSSGRVERAKEVIVCAGVQSDRLASLTQTEADPTEATLRIVPFRGSYYDLTPDAAPFVRSMIYPVPDPKFPFLGVHYTRHADGSVSVGPNAVIAFAREIHRRFAINPQDVIDYLSYPGFWKMVKQYINPQVMGEMVRDVSFPLFYRNAKAYLPDVKPTDFEPGPLGIRAQAIDGNGKLVDDFAFLRRGRVLHVQNAPSPAATASMSIAEHIYSQLGRV